MKKTAITLQSAVILIVAWLLAIAPACNSKSDSDDDSTTALGTVAVTGFSLSADIRVMKNLDSVYFAIDLDHGVIYNADSLPKGTNVTKLVPKITYPNTVTGATIEMTGGEHRTGTVNYLANPTDTIDFSGKVTLTLSSATDNLTKTYDLKVNVHQEEPDTLYWEKMASTALPSRGENPVAQKTVATATTIYSFIEESDGTFSLATTGDLFSGSWGTKVLTFGFKPSLATATACGDKIYMLATNGDLYVSSDGFSWLSTGENWINIIGGYGDNLLGIRNSGGAMVSTLLGVDDSEVDLPEDFPLRGFSAPAAYNSKWLTSPTLLVTGGEKADGTYTGSTWAFDGRNWAAISNTPLPGIYAPGICSYYSYLKSSSGRLKEFEVLLAFGGKLSDGSINKSVYISYNQGISWQKAPEYMQLPATVPAIYDADIITEAANMESDLSSRWKIRSMAGRRIAYEIEGDILSWECPYIFIFGGYNTAGNLNSEIYCGVLRRLTFAPLF